MLESIQQFTRVAGINKQYNGQKFKKNQFLVDFYKGYITSGFLKISSLLRPLYTFLVL